MCLNELSLLLQESNLTHNQLGTMLGVNGSTISRWARSSRWARNIHSFDSHDKCYAHFRMVHLIVAILRKALKPHEVRVWFIQPNPNLDSLAPIDAFQEGTYLIAIIDAANRTITEAGH